MFSLKRIFKDGASESWPHFVTVLSFMLLVAGFPFFRDDWGSLFRLLAADLAFGVLAFVALYLHRRWFEPRRERCHGVRPRSHRRAHVTSIARVRDLPNS
jgi:hypothetical protein